MRRPEMKARAMTKALEILYPIKNSVSATDYVNLIADRLNVEYTSVAQALRETKAPMAARHQDEQAVSQASVQPVSAAAAEIMEADQQSTQMERELVSLLVTDMHLLDDIGPLLVRIKWTDAASEAMADALLAVPHDATAAQALLAVQAAVPQAPTLLAQVMVDIDGHAEKLYRARLLLRGLRRRDLERDVRSAKARMQGDPNLSGEQLDELFNQVVAMQEELAKLRNDALPQ